jgi:hypothetical protein
LRSLFWMKADWISQILLNHLWIISWLLPYPKSFTSK